MTKPFCQVLLEELHQIDCRRDGVLGSCRGSKVRDDQPADQQALDRDLVGMGISGGGIRSATFNLGILQGLAEHGLLSQLDYLSTVSGGGYIGSWLHAVIQQMHRGSPAGANQRLSPVANPVPQGPADDPVSFLRKYSNYLAPRFSLFSTDLWVIGSIWIRNVFLNWCVLVPFLAAALLVPVAGGMLHELLDDRCKAVPYLNSYAPQFLVQMLVNSARQTAGCGPDGINRHQMLLLVSIVAAGVLLLVAVRIMASRLKEVASRTFAGEAGAGDARAGGAGAGKAGQPPPPADTRSAGVCSALIFLSAMLIGSTPTDPRHWIGGFLACAALVLLFLLLPWKGGFVRCYEERHASKAGGRVLAILMPLVCAGVTALLLVILLASMRDWDVAGLTWTVLTWGPVLVLLVLSLGVTLLLGLMGADYPDAAREWISRLGALLSIWSAAWVAAILLGVYSPRWIALFFASLPATALATAGGWVATSAAGVLSANSSNTRAPGAPGTKTALEIVAKIAPAVFMLGFLMLLSFGLHWGIRETLGLNRDSARARPEASVRREGANGGAAVSAGPTGEPRAAAQAQPDQKPPDRKPPAEARRTGPAWTSRVLDNHWEALRPNARLTGRLVAAIAILFGLSVLFASRVNINEFSMHHFYKNRLVRCYLGASKGRQRHPDAWTGFDPQDDIPLRDLCARNNYWGPYPIVNTALNLNRGSELAKQERKAGSFVYTPLYCGFTPEHSEMDRREVEGLASLLLPDGYTPTEEFGGKGGPHLGSAMAISGAAANPNMGFHTSGPVAFLLTVFNVRLGWWVGNPRREKAARRPGPRTSLLYLLNELAGRTDERSHYLNLSDGGHFDNLGLYELVRRRCRFIIIGDGEQDPGLNFGSLAGAIRKCQTDFGVTIDIDVRGIQETNGLSRTHCVIGTIAYPEPDSSVTTASEYRTGLLLYFKASLTGDEPEDVREFRSRFSEFPHQSTADQFFTESQFESYRNLGLHIARTALQDGARKNGKEPSVRDLFRQLRRAWSPAPAIADGVAARLSAAYSALLDELKDDGDLRYLDREIVPGLPESAADPAPDGLRKGFLFCLNCIRLAESVYLDLHFSSTRERENHSNQGWVTIFRYWATQPHIREVWSTVKVTLNPQFQQYFQSLVDGE